MLNNSYDPHFGVSPKDVNSKSEFTWSDAKKTADLTLCQSIGKHLSDIEIKLLQGSWEEKTYDEMALNYGYSAEYLNKDVGNKLWHKLSKTLGEKVTKKNFKAALSRAWEKQNDSSAVENLDVEKKLDIEKNLESRISPVVQLPFPESSVPPDSSFYIERNNIENLCYQTITKPGSLIRIKAPKLMGKTSLMNRIIAHATGENYQTVYLDLSSVERRILTNLDTFLRWLSIMASRQLKLENQLNDYWDAEILGSNDNCTVYFEEYLLTETENPIVLALDNVDKIFCYSEVIEDFFGMLRSWHEKAKVTPIWQNLRLVLAHSTEVYVPLDINQSLFNAGVPVELVEFDKQQVIKLASIHGLSWNEAIVKEMMKLIGGHPFLVRLAMYQVAAKNLKLEELLQSASTEAGIYSNHLRGYLQALQQSPNLAEAFNKVVNSSLPVELNSIGIYKLHSMGLVERQDNHVVPRCNLYREYFQRVLV
ncbi:AAA-like domain-containing protein [Mastigocoleus sp. MO_188.B34]|uniref:AAA-like domain-containing protein n=1 Tax=Mastigocoleus sp. MO_188.B34 TaxID=3036635 RepID=UPI00261A6962|nr:AAA-like domain-containing protein [Mastigocoleus sp. MO_188.B34]MDJ0697622.1 AAA-like domain-containing protein [Mastigocoleus sp. MO_188.B34]